MSLLLSKGERRRLEELRSAPEDEWCRGVWANALLYSLGFDDFFVQVNWQKLAGRRVEAVRTIFKALESAKPEQRQRIITNFAKKYPAIPREKRAS